MVCHESYGVTDGAMGCRMNLRETINGKYTIESFSEGNPIYY